MSAEKYFSLEGFATPAGTAKYAADAISSGRSAKHFRVFDGLYLSSIGMGTYLGDITRQDDMAVENAVYESIKSGAVNVIDTAINYRAMKSEKSIGRVLRRLTDEGIISRDQVFISTKNGYITNDGDFPSVDVTEYIHRMYIAPQLISADDISSGYHVMHPDYIARCIDKSLLNMRLDTIDLVYIHNAYESWCHDIGREEFMQKLAKVFEVYEKYRSYNKIRYYGMATWTCFRVEQYAREYLSLEEVVKLAENVGGKGHGFRFIQLPYNLAYSEALLLRNQTVGSEKGLTILEAAARLKIGIFTSVPLFQGRLLGIKIPDFAGPQSNLAKLIQIVRSSPSVIAPLVGQKKTEHVRENLEISNIDPLDQSQFNHAIKSLMDRPLS